MAICYQSPIKPITIPQSKALSNPKLSFRCNLSLPSRSYPLTITEPEPVYASVKTFAPATIANLGPGFDFLGCAVDGLGDFVSLSLDTHVHPGEISISEISGDNANKLSKSPLWNCDGIAAIEVMKMLGSSAASAAAAAVAVNEIFGGKLGAEEGTSDSGQLFTYGDGTFGVLVHGNFQRVPHPKEVKSLKGLRVKSVACGSWHTTAIVEILVDCFKYNAVGGKLFTWGDGDKGRLGHTDHDKKLLPTCVAQLVERDFIQVVVEEC